MPGFVTDLVQVHPYRRRGGMLEHLLLRRSEDEELAPGIWQVITGGIGPGESSEEGALRELREETGLEAVSCRAMPEPAIFYFAQRDQIVLSPVFACELSADAEIVLSAEHVEHLWLPVDEACALLVHPSQRDGARAVEALLAGERR
jgi:8-oxo-dGTP pyrophosphatase MutT (NUDIX family)